ncbi:MAG: right-handed parallel beta-helix repeat-containing protein [Fuerstiella sp.]|nr:right-handed parallel beta-helix repeat-containing protein [Fuerstiella sp.]MCP4857464.1 right-handed parallel beta-helix repeat-containing protein [Fuerstiella sp.]
MTQCKRRSFLGTAAIALASTLPRSSGDERPPVMNPRATDGDEHIEPDWKQRLTLAVGTKSGDLIGTDDKVIQAAVDYVSRLGGGTVRLLPGIFTFRNAVHLPSKIRLLGSGDDTVITRTASETIPLSADSDWYDQEITLEQAGDFRIGDGITLMAKNPSNGSSTVIKRTLLARAGNRFKLSDGLRKNLWLSGKPTCSSLFPLLTSEYTSDVLVENLTLDGNRANCTNLNGNYGGCIFLQDCSRYTFRNVTTRNYNGDGISFQICHDVVVENCHSHDNADLGVHPGSGSQRPLIKGNKLERNNLGLFWCWGVKYGLAEDNDIDGNRSYGISIGHSDTDNVMRNNRILNSGKVGILFRDDARGVDFWANRNLIENNRIVNSGDADGVGIDITGRTKDVRIFGNDIVEDRQPMQRSGIRIGADVGNVHLRDNTIHGFQNAVVDHRGNKSS